MIARASSLALIALGLLCGAPASAGTPASGGTPAGSAGKLEREIGRIVRKAHGPPGVSVVVRGGNGTTRHTAGLANVSTHRRMKANQPMRIASVAKAFNGAVILTLVDRGKLRLSDALGHWLPGVWPKARKVTVRQMLQHRGGLPEYIENEGFLAFLRAHPRGYLTPREILDYVTDEKTDFTPGSRYQYSDTDNIALGLIAQKATGHSYEALLKRHVYRPAGLRETSLPKTVALPHNYMHGYDVEGDGPPEDASKAINPALAWASGGIVSTSHDLGRFIRAYVSGELFGGAARRAQTAHLVTGSSSPPGPGANRAGLALFRYRTSCGTIFGHTGSFPGYRQFAASSRDGKRSVVFTVNSQITPGRGEVSDRISDMIRAAQTTAVCKALR